jgi:hypothetical protein
MKLLFRHPQARSLAPVARPGLFGCAVALLVFSAPLGAQVGTADAAPVTAQAPAANTLRVPRADDLGVRVPPQVKAATALLGLGRQRLALVVGNGKLGTRDVLDSAYRDSRAVAAALRAGGFIVMAREDLTARDLRASLLEFRSRLQPGGIGFIYVAALGAQLEGRNLLLPRDLVLDADTGAPDVVARLQAGAVPLAEVVNALIGTPDSPRMLVVDAAYQHPALARLAAPGLAEQSLPPGMMALFGHALHGVKDVPAVAPLGPTPPDDPREIAASTFGRVLVAAMLSARIKPPDMLRRTRSALFDASGGAIAPWLGGETSGDEELAEEPITALLPRTPEELAREAMRRLVRNLVRMPGGGGAGTVLLPPPAPVAAAAPPVETEQTAKELIRQNKPTANPPHLEPQAADGTRRPLRLSPTGAAGEVPNAPAEGVGTLGKAAGAAANTLTGVAGVAANAATVVAGVKAAETLLVAQAAGTAATAAVGAVSTAGTVLAKAAALGSRVGSGSSSDTAATALATTAQAAPVVGTAAALSLASTAAGQAAPEGRGQAPNGANIGPTAQAAPTGPVAGTGGTQSAVASSTTPPTGAAPAGQADTVPASAGQAMAPKSVPAEAGQGAPTTPAAATAPTAPTAQTAQAAQTAPTAPNARTATPPQATGLQPPAQSGPPLPRPPRFNAFGFGEGDSFLYQVTDLNTEQAIGSYMQIIEEVLPDGGLRANGDQLQLDPEGRIRSQRHPDGSVSQYEPYQQLWWAKPRPGQEREIRYTEKYQNSDGRQGQIEWTGDAEVGDLETLSTPGGDFVVVAIKSSGYYTDRATQGRGSQGRWRQTVWYSIEMGHPVARTIEQFERSGRVLRKQRIELTNAQRARTGQ